LLSQGRGPEADLLLQKALKTDPNNISLSTISASPKEMEGESQEALKYYDSAAAVHSDAGRRGLRSANLARQSRSPRCRAEMPGNLRTHLDTQMTRELQMAELKRGEFPL